jgi:hypothetical protein
MGVANARIEDEDEDDDENEDEVRRLLAIGYRRSAVSAKRAIGYARS